MPVSDISAPAQSGRLDREYVLTTCKPIHRSGVGEGSPLLSFGFYARQRYQGAYSARGNRISAWQLKDLLDAWPSAWAMRFSLYQNGLNGFLDRTHLSLDQGQQFSRQAPSHFLGAVIDRR